MSVVGFYFSNLLFSKTYDSTHIRIPPTCSTFNLLVNVEIWNFVHKKKKKNTWQIVGNLTYLNWTLFQSDQVRKYSDRKGCMRVLFKNVFFLSSANKHKSHVHIFMKSRSPFTTEVEEPYLKDLCYTFHHLESVTPRGHSQYLYRTYFLLGLISSLSIRFSQSSMSLS